MFFALFAGACVAVLGLCVSAVFTCIELCGIDVAAIRTISGVLQPMLLVIFLPVVVFARHTNRNGLQGDLWNKAMEDGLAWFPKAVSYFIYSAIFFFVALIVVPSTSIWHVRIDTAIFPAFMTAFYGISAMIYYSAVCKYRKIGRL